MQRKCEDYVMLIAMMLAYVCLANAEVRYLEEDSNHYLLAESVSVEVEYPLGSGKVIQVASTECHLHDRA